MFYEIFQVMPGVHSGHTGHIFMADSEEQAIGSYLKKWADHYHLSLNDAGAYIDLHGRIVWQPGWASADMGDFYFMARISE